MEEFKPVETKDKSTVNPTTKAGKSLRPNSSTVEKSETLKEAIALKFFQEAFGGQLDESTSNEDILEVVNCLVDLCEAVCEAVALGEDGTNEITHKGSCNEVHPDMSHEDWEKEQRIQGEEEPNENEMEDIVNIESVEHLDESKFSEIDMHLKDGKSPEEISKIMNLPLAAVTSATNNARHSTTDSSFRGSEDLLNTIKQIGSAHGPNRPKSGQDIGVPAPSGKHYTPGLQSKLKRS